MYKVEIITVVGSFIAETPEEVNKDIDITTAGDYIADLAENGRFVELDDLSVVRFKDPSIIKGYRVFDDPTAGRIAPVTNGDEAVSQGQSLPWEPHPDTVRVWNSKVKYLGEYRDIEVLSAWNGVDKVYYMLHKLNGMPAVEFVSYSNYSGIVTLWLRQVYQYEGDTVEVIIPHGTIDDLEEAKEYLKDYMKETKTAYKSKEKTGKAFMGWNEDRGLKK